MSSIQIKSIDALEAADQLNDNCFIPVCQNGVAKKLSGKQLKEFTSQGSGGTGNTGGTSDSGGSGVTVSPYTTTALDFTNWALGYFTETLSDGSVVTHDVYFDGYGNVTSVGGIALSGVS